MSTSTPLTFPSDPSAWAQELGISQAAVELYLDSEVLDLHNDLYVPARLIAYNVHRRHRPGWGGARLMNQTDLPRLRAAALSGVVFDIVTNPARRSARRTPITLKNIQRVKDDIGKHPTHFRFVRNYGEYQAARREGLTAAFIGIQGGQAFQANQASLDAIPEDVHRITLVHLTNSRIGTTSSPLGPDRGGLPQRGRELVEVMNAKRILVDLAHINRAGFMDAADVHDRSQPLICTHTGVSGVHDHWRNIDDEQIRRVTDTGGVIGVIFHSMFLAPVLHGLARCPMEAILLHMEHVIHIAGEHAVSIGTDYDGMIVPPLPLQQVTDLPRLVQGMLDRKWPETRIRGALGLNALRVFQEIRP